MTPRPLVAEDETTVARIARTAADADGVAPLDEAALLDVSHLRGSIVAADGGFALVRGSELDVVVAPASRQAGLGRRLARSALSVLGPVATAWSHGDHPAARRLAAELGFARSRELWVMRLAPLDPPALTVPPDVTIRPFTPADADAFLAVNAAAFAGHPEQGRLTRAGLEERLAQPGSSPEGLLLAVDADGRVLGFHWTKQHSPTEGEVYVVGVAPEAQGRGLGPVLTLAGLHHLRSRGVTSMHLYVEADNAGAIAIYRRLGFTHADRDTHVQYRRTA